MVHALIRSFSQRNTRSKRYACPSPSQVSIRHSLLSVAFASIRACRLASHARLLDALQTSRSPKGAPPRLAAGDCSARPVRPPLTCGLSSEHRLLLYTRRWQGPGAGSVGRFTAGLGQRKDTDTRRRTLAADFVVARWLLAAGSSPKRQAAFKFGAGCRASSFGQRVWVV